MGMPLNNVLVTLSDSHVLQLVAMVDYIRGIHHHIDPDYFNLDLGALKLLGDRLETENSFRFDLESQFLLEMAVNAAEAYSARRGFEAVPNMAEADFESLMRRMAEIHGQLIGKTGAV